MYGLIHNMPLPISTFGGCSIRFKVVQQISAWFRSVETLFSSFIHSFNLVQDWFTLIHHRFCLYFLGSTSRLEFFTFGLPTLALVQPVLLYSASSHITFTSLVFLAVGSRCSLPYLVSSSSLRDDLFVIALSTPFYATTELLLTL